MNQSEIEEKIRQFVLTSFLTEAPAGSFDNHDDLFLLLDSLQILRMVSQLESWFGIRIEQAELLADNLGTVSNAAAFVTRKLSPTQPATSRRKSWRAASF